MSQRQVDHLFTGGTVVTMDGEWRIYKPGAVAISGTEIVAVGPDAEVAAGVRAAHTLQCADQVIMPGLVNAHTHVPMSLLRGLADDLRLDVWLHGYMIPVEARFVNPGFARLGTLLACAEFIRGGVTCFADMYYFEDDIAWTTTEAGLRGMCGQTIMNLPTPDAQSYDESLAACEDFIRNWQGHDLITAVPAPHSPYMCSPEVLRDTVRMARQYDVPLQIHVAETALEVQESIEAHDMTPTRWLESVGLFEAKVLAAHCVHVNNEDMHILAAHGVGVSHNPSSNLKLASGFAPVVEMRGHGVSVGLGTDGAASNNDLDIWVEMHIAALLPKAVHSDPTVLPARDALAMATIDGARAMHLDHLIGSLEVGKRADLIVVDEQRVHVLPRFDTTGQNVYSRLVYGAGRDDVCHVMVNGKMLMRDRELLTIDEHAALREAEEMGKRINVFFVEREKNLLNKLLAIGGLDRQETFEVQVKAHIPRDRSVSAWLDQPEITVVRYSERNQYDTYFLFANETARIRYREDNVLEANGKVTPIYNLTYTGPIAEQEYENSVVLTRSRYASHANRSLRFYREYFQPRAEREIIKHRHRYHVRFRGMPFAINVDEIIQPPQEGLFVEIKSRTWSANDAVRKAELIGEMLALFGLTSDHIVRQDYADL
ncbi:MAG: amidohydrolase family protein [Anaerolineae bacterium]|nr:amidohydrolase family protein [Anaerolineae bacterium]